MIDITLLKVKHSLVSEARKLIPFIQNCDVFGIENAGASEEEADRVERYMQEAYLLSRNEFCDWARECTKNFIPVIGEYNFKEQERIYTL